jgi:hypothetical protein
MHTSPSCYCLYMARAISRPQNPPDWSPEKTQAVLKRQLSALDQLRSKSYRLAASDERGWYNLTLNVITHGFGEGSNNVQQLRSANVVGQVFEPRMSEGQYQNNFLRRLDALGAVVKSCLDELELMLPEAGITGVYESGDEYEFYKDLKMVVGFATKGLFVIDNYLDTQLFDIYMANVGTGVTISVLTNQVGGSLKAVAQKLAGRGSFELRSSNNVHDRVVFADDRCWVIGQSIKDAARKKPTYIVEHAGAVAMRGIYDAIWAAAISVVKG